MSCADRYQIRLLTLVTVPVTAQRAPTFWAAARTHGMLALHWEGVDHAVFVFWKGEEREHDFWYFNLQDAPRRHEIGVR